MVADDVCRSLQCLSGERTSRRHVGASQRRALPTVPPAAVTECAMDLPVAWPSALRRRLFAAPSLLLFLIMHVSSTMDSYILGANI